MRATERPDGLEPGLYFVPTPLGNARDITLRALDILAEAEVLAAEDTRSLKRLMEIHGIPLRERRILAYHDHNGPVQRPVLLAALAEGRSVAYASEAGTPLVADPGYALCRDAVAAGHKVHAVPGPSAAIAALTVAGLPSDRFIFAGFPPASGGARRSFLDGLADIPATLILYESPKRLAKTLADCAERLGPERQAAVCRELTKKFEEVTRAPLAELAEAFTDRTVKGEIVICIDRGAAEVPAEVLEAAMREAMGRLRLKDAAAEVAAQFGVSRRDMYQLGLEMGD